MNKLTDLFRPKPPRHQRVLQVFLDRPGERLYGLDIARYAGLRGGTLYPSLARLETERWIMSDWDGPPQPSGGRRRVYWLNPWKVVE